MSTQKIMPSVGVALDGEGAGIVAGVGGDQGHEEKIILAENVDYDETLARIVAGGENLSGNREHGAVSVRGGAPMIYATLDARRLAFLLRLRRAAAYRKACAVFDYLGGELIRMPRRC